MFIFDGESADGEKSYYRCRRRNMKCKARIHVGLNNVVVKTIGEHSHESSAATLEVAAVVTGVKRRAAESQEIPSVVINNCGRNLSVAGQGICPSDKAMKMTIRRARKQNANAPAAPENLTDLEIPEVYREYNVEEGVTENFLLGDSGADEQRILIFGRRRGLDTSETWYADGTFTITPTLFGQVFVIMTLTHCTINYPKKFFQ